MQQHVGRMSATGHGGASESLKLAGAVFLRFAERFPVTFAVLATALTTTALLPLRAHLDEASWGTAYLVLVAAVGALGGRRAAVVSAVSGFAAWNFVFTRPYYTFNVARPQTWLALVAFLVVSSIVGLLTSSVRESRKASARSEWEARVLAAVSADLLACVDVDSTVATVLRAVDDAVAPEEAAVLLPEPGTTRLRPRWLEPSTEWRPDVMSTAEDVYRTVRAVGAPAGGHPGAAPPDGIDGMFVPLHTRDHVHGVLYVGPPAHQLRFEEADRRLVASIAVIASSALERVLLAGEVAGAAARRQAEDLKSTVVSSVSHELRTPLASVVATVTGLLERQDLLGDEARGELEAVMPDLHRLETAIDDLLDLSRLEGEAWRMRFEEYEIGEVIGSALAGLAPATRSRVGLELADDLPPVRLDFKQVVRALRVLLDNAASYAPSEGPITVGARVLGGSMLLWVRDEGPGVPAEERERIFEKFYRSASTARLAGGTGLGLAIVREIARGHGGTAWVEPVEPHGSCFSFTLRRDQDVE